MVAEKQEDYETYYPYRKKFFDRENKTALGRDFESWCKMSFVYILHSQLVTFKCSFRVVSEQSARYDIDLIK